MSGKTLLARDYIEALQNRVWPPEMAQAYFRAIMDVARLFEKLDAQGRESGMTRVFFKRDGVLAFVKAIARGARHVRNFGVEGARVLCRVENGVVSFSIEMPLELTRGEVAWLEDAASGKPSRDERFLRGKLPVENRGGDCDEHFAAPVALERNLEFPSRNLGAAGVAPVLVRKGAVA